MTKRVQKETRKVSRCMTSIYGRPHLTCTLFLVLQGVPQLGVVQPPVFTEVKPHPTWCTSTCCRFSTSYMNMYTFLEEMHVLLY